MYVVCSEPASNKYSTSLAVVRYFFTNKILMLLRMAMCPAKKLHFPASLTVRIPHEMLEEVIVRVFQETSLKGTDSSGKLIFSPLLHARKVGMMT